MKNFIILLISAMLLIITSCEEVVTLDLPESDNRLVVEGIISNEAGPYTVKLSRTQKYSFKNTSSVIYVEGAKVVISDDKGTSDTLQETSKGIYKTHAAHISGQIGSSYKIDIVTSDGKHYLSKPEKMQDVTKIDSIYFDRNANDRSSAYSDSYRYKVYIDWKDPANEKNYYMFVISYYWNNVWHNEIQWNTVMNDYSADGHIFKKFLINSSYGQKYFIVKVNLYSLSKVNYDYWRNVYNQTYVSFDGYINNTVPLVGNVYNANDPNDYAIGYFQVSGTNSAQVYIDQK